MQVKMWDRFTGSRCRFRNVLKQVKTLSNRDHITPEVSRWYHLKIAQTSEFAFVKYDLTPLEVFASLCFWRNKILNLNITLNDLSRWIDFAVLEKEKTDSHFPGDANRFVKKKKKERKNLQLALNGFHRHKGHITPSACWRMMSVKVKIQQKPKVKM